METKPKNDIELEIDNQLNSISRIGITSITPEIFFEEHQKNGIPVSLQVY